MHWSLSNIKRNGVIRYPGICIGESSCGREAILVWLESQDRGRLASPLHQQQGVEASWPHQAPASLHLPHPPTSYFQIFRWWACYKVLWNWAASHILWPFSDLKPRVLSHVSCQGLADVVKKVDENNRKVHEALMMNRDTRGEKCA